MSARAWREKLFEEQRAHGEAITRAIEWKQVADERLKSLQALNDGLAAKIKHLASIGSIFEASCECDIDLTQPLVTTNGFLVYESICKRLNAVDAFIAHLTHAAGSLQVTFAELISMAEKFQMPEAPDRNELRASSSEVRAPDSSILEECISYFNDDQEMEDSTGKTGDNSLVVTPSKKTLF